MPSDVAGTALPANGVLSIGDSPSAPQARANHAQERYGLEDMFDDFGAAFAPLKGRSAEIAVRRSRSCIEDRQFE